MEFLIAQTIKALHDVQIGAYGGLPGVRDENLLESALARPMNAHADGVDDVFALAATLAFGIARNHPFLDANKRTAWASARTFLRLNGVRFTPDREAAVLTMVALAEGSLSEDDFAAWLRKSAGAP